MCCVSEIRHSHQHLKEGTIASLFDRLNVFLQSQIPFQVSLKNQMILEHGKHDHRDVRNLRPDPVEVGV